MAAPTSRRFDLNSTWTAVLPAFSTGDTRVHQGVAWDEEHGWFFISQLMMGGIQLPDEPAALSATVREQRGDLQITKFNAADGANLGKMYVRGAGHGWSLDAEAVAGETFLWTEIAAVRDGTYGWGTQLGRFQFVPDAVLDSGGPGVDMYDPVPGMLRVAASFDFTTNRVVVHYKEPNGTRNYALYVLGDFLARNFAVASTFVARPVSDYQNFVMWGQYLYELQGAPTDATTNPAPGNTYIGCTNVTTGELIELVYQTQQPSMNYREPETLSVRATSDGTELVIGFASGGTGARQVNLFDFAVLAPDPLPPSTRRFDLKKAATSLLEALQLHEMTAPQQIAFDTVHGHFFVTQIIQDGRQLSGESAPVSYTERARRGDLCITRLSPAGAVTGFMYVLGAGHGTALSCEPQGADSYLWLEASSMQVSDFGYGTRVGRVKFTDAAVVRQTDTALEVFDPFPGQRLVFAQLDMPTRRITVRYTEPSPGRDITYTTFDFDDFKARRFDQPVGEFPEVGRVGTFQAFCLFGQYVYWHEGGPYGDGNAPPGNHYIGVTRSDGRLVERVFQGAAPDLPRREPEVLNVYYGLPGAPEPVLMFGYSVETPEGRALKLFTLALYPLPSTPPVLPVTPLPATGVFAAGGPVPDITSVTARIPFSVTRGGWVSTTTDEFLALLDRVHALVSTQPGERAMRATYGVPTASQLFMPADMAKVELEQSIADAVTRWEPSARVSGVLTDINQGLGLVNVRVQVARADAPQQDSATVTRQVRIGVGGAVSHTPGYYRPPTATS